MNIYKKMYLRLFNSITDVLEVNDIDVIKEKLKEAQIEAEEIYISAEDK